MDLSGKIALVTGAGRGIGRQIALTLAGYGATVIVNYNGSKEKAEETVKEMRKTRRAGGGHPVMLADFSQSRELIDAIVKKYGRLDILVNNAGITRDNLIMKMSEDDFDAVVATNLKGAFNCVKHVSRQMLKQKNFRQDHQYLLGFRRYGECRPGQLLRLQGGAHRPYKIRGQGAGKPRDHVQRSGSRFYPYRNDRRSAR